ncbi:hypothetical protein I302_104727 [Kwoniella bestiolae CBS 10118]|uniref:CHCH domain-containing protein n=1 Tax=Kwoniella bestiolae CBS 10118 TaxID=1296100 RepID=A0A1B9FRX1_9TREE|nr:hypothetical protein I302_09202 [Kwoniella bestiolae CBS 10118]OCF21523.1 hypothetical protein I302_09202 [Kwoniella bestiolae CBS 10118]
MPRSSRSSARPASRPAAPAGGSHQQTRQSSTAAYPAQHAPAQTYPQQHAGAGVQQGKPPGLLAQAASTMGGAVAGSVVGHGISNMLFGSSRPAEQAAGQVPVDQQQQQMVNGQQFGQGASCDIQAKDFTKCLEATNGDMQSCSYYLEALKACQAAARPY